MTRYDVVEVKLSASSGQTLRVQLNLTIAQLDGAQGVEDEAVSHVELATFVPDGDYDLDYFYFKAIRSRVRVSGGVLLGPA